MAKTFNLTLPVLVSLVFMMSVGCGRPSKLPGQDAGLFSSEGQSALSYDLLRDKIFAPKCLMCHANFGTYEGMMASGSVIASNPDQSRLYLLTANGQMPKGGSPLSLDEVKAIYEWINTGAKQSAAPVEGGGLAGPAPVPAPGTVPPTHPAPMPSTPPVGGAPSAPSPTFEWLRANVFIPKCIICHRGANAPGGYDLSSYESVVAGGRVVAGNPAASSLFGRVNNNSMPLGAPALSAEHKLALRQWIENGARNDAPVGGVPAGPAAPLPSLPPLEPKFASIMANIIGPRCLQCHGSATPSGGVSLKDYTGVRRHVVPGNAGRSDLYDEVAKNDMPASGSPLTFEQKETIRQWINSGAQNN